MWVGWPHLCLTSEVAPGPRMTEDMLEGLFLSVGQSGQSEGGLGYSA